MQCHLMVHLIAVLQFGKNSISANMIGSDSFPVRFNLIPYLGKSNTDLCLSVSYLAV